MEVNHSCEAYGPSKCNQHLGKARPWLGQSGKLRKRRTIRKPRSQTQSRVTADDVLNSGHLQPTQYVTRSGRTVRKPVRLVVQDFQEDIKGGGSYEKSHDTRNNCEGSRENCRSQLSRESQRSCSSTQPELLTVEQSTS